MDEDISIINANTRQEKIKNFFIKNRKSLIAILSSIILIVFAYFAFGEIKDRKMKNLAEKYNNILINFNSSNKIDFKNDLVEIINDRIVIKVFLLFIKKSLIFSFLVLVLIIDISSSILNHIP